MKQLTSYNRVAGYLNKLFDLLNDHYFESSLVRPTITIQSTPRAYGHFSILITRNEFYGIAVAGTGAHNSTGTSGPPRTSSSRKYICPCCGNSVRATKCVHIACMDCREEMVLAEKSCDL